MRLQAILDIIEIVIAILNSKQPVSLAKDWASMLTIVEYSLMNSCQFLRASHLQMLWSSGKYDTQVRLFQESTLDKWHLLFCSILRWSHTAELVHISFHRKTNPISACLSDPSNCSFLPGERSFYIRVHIAYFKFGVCQTHQRVNRTPPQGGI